MEHHAHFGGFSDLREKGHCKIRRIIRKGKRKFDTDACLVSMIGVELRRQIIFKNYRSGRAAQDLLEYVYRKKRKHPERCRLLLFEAIDLLATFKTENRALVRTALDMLHTFARAIHRKVVLFENANLATPFHLEDSARAKQEYIFSQVAGWAVPWNTLADSGTFYLDLPFLKQGYDINESDIHSNIMAEALYRLQDPRMVLSLLRNGVSPSALYLWPIAIIIDLKLTLDKNTFIDPQSADALSLRYFCRSRAHFQVHFVHMQEDRVEAISNIRCNNFDDVLLISENAIHLIPEDRHLHPARLMHLCRIAVRDALLNADQLPHGIGKLNLPTMIKEYVDLQMD